MAASCRAGSRREKLRLLQRHAAVFLFRVDGFPGANFPFCVQPEMRGRQNLATARVSFVVGEARAMYVDY